jgi:hypothetical protein
MHAIKLFAPFKLVFLLAIVHQEHVLANMHASNSVCLY